MRPSQGKTPRARSIKPLHALAFYLVLIATFTVGGALMVSLATALGFHMRTGTQLTAILGLSAQALLTIGVIALFIRTGRFHSVEALSLRSYRRTAVYLLAPLVIVVLGLLLGRLAGYLVDVVPGLGTERLVEFIDLSRMRDPGMYALLALVMALGPGVTEELAFRGFILAGLRSRLGPGAAVLVTALLFALLHVDPLHMVLAFPPGLFLGYLVIRTGSLYPAIVAHAMNNLGSTLEAGLWQAVRPHLEATHILFASVYPPAVLGIALVGLVGGLVTIHRLTAGSVRHGRFGR